MASEREKCPLIEMHELQEIQETSSVMGPGRSTTVAFRLDFKG